MKRIAIFEFSISPQKEDFIKLNAQLLLSKLFIAYGLTNDNKIEMIHLSKLSEIFTAKETAKIKADICKRIESVPGEIWDRMCKKLKLKLY